MKKKTQKTVRVLAVALCVLTLWLAILVALQALLTPKFQTGVVEGSMIAEYYRDASPHEVLMVGDCELYENISTIELWRKYGITSYIRGSAQQLVWQSYYLLEDALRCETPKVAVFNVLSLKYNEPQKEAYNRMSIDGMRWSSSKIGAIKASMTEEEHFYDYLFPLLYYHARWSQLTDDDFTYWFSRRLVTHNGYYLRADVKEQGEFPEAKPLSDYTLGENAMSYLEKMVDLCRARGVKLVLVKAPIEYPHWYDEWDKQIVDFSEKNGVDYINFIPLKEEIGLDMSTDTYDAGLHLNVYGAEKLADYFGAWLTGHADLTDFRNDEKISALWQKKTENYEKEKSEQQAEIEESGALLSHKPIETKETGIVRNFIILALAAVLCVLLIACGTAQNTKTAEKATEKPTESPAASVETKASEKTDGYAFTLKGVQVALHAEMAPIVAKLGEPTKYFESESCAYQGLDKVYTYGGVTISTYPDNGVDYVLDVVLRDDTVSTPEGISIGDPLSKVEEIYGAPNETRDNAVCYVKNGTQLTFFIDNGTVYTISYEQPVK